MVGNNTAGERAALRTYLRAFQGVPEHDLHL